MLETATCRHWWLIATPYNGEPSPGCCKYCGAEREFGNIWDWPASPPYATRYCHTCNQTLATLAFPSPRAKDCRECVAANK